MVRIRQVVICNPVSTNFRSFVLSAASIVMGCPKLSWLSWFWFPVLQLNGYCKSQIPRSKSSLQKSEGMSENAKLNRGTPTARIAELGDEEDEKTSQRARKLRVGSVKPAVAPLDLHVISVAKAKKKAKKKK